MFCCVHEMVSLDPCRLVRQVSENRRLEQISIRPLPPRVAGESDTAALKEPCDLTRSQTRQRENLIHLPVEPGRGLVELIGFLSNQ